MELSKALLFAGLKLFVEVVLLAWPTGKAIGYLRMEAKSTPLEEWGFMQGCAFLVVVMTTTYVCVEANQTVSDVVRWFT